MLASGCTIDGSMIRLTCTCWLWMPHCQSHSWFQRNRAGLSLQPSWHKEWEYVTELTRNFTGKIACKQFTQIYKCSRLQVWFEEWELDKRDLPTIHSLQWSFTTQNETKRMQGTKPRSSTPKVQPCINDPVYLLYMLMPEGILQYPNMSFQWYYIYNFYSWFTMMRFLLVLSFAFW